MRFHLDEHVPHAIAEGLRHRGIDDDLDPSVDRRVFLVPRGQGLVYAARLQGISQVRYPIDPRVDPGPAGREGTGVGRIEPGGIAVDGGR